MERPAFTAIVLSLVSIVCVAQVMPHAEMTPPTQITPPTQPRDAPPPTSRTGTAAIRGRVYSADTGQPVRRAIVMLMTFQPPAPPPPQGTQPSAVARNEAPSFVQPRNVATDAAGRFEFTGLPTGSYRLRVSPSPQSGQYLPMAFGSKGWMDAGRTIELKDGQEFSEANFALLRGGAIVGRVIDDMGDPMSRVMVFVSRIMPGTGAFQRTGGGFIQSDDHGRYRIYGLEPGEYIVAAESRNMGGPAVEGIEPEGFVTTHHPSATQERDAARVRVRASSDVEGIDIQLVRTRTYRITGTVMDSQGRLVTRPNAQLGKQTSVGGGYSSVGVSVDPQGRFTISNVVPGDYTFIVRPGSFGGPPPPPGSGPAPDQNPEYAMLPLTVSADIENLVVVTQPGVTVAGHVVFTDGGEAAAGGTLRVMTQPANRMMMMGPTPSATVGRDNTFTLSNVIGACLVRMGGLRRDWALRAVMLGNTDITDTPVEFKKEHSGHLQIVISTRAASLEGAVMGDDGKPVEQATIMVFPEDKGSWRMGSPRVRMGTSYKDGKYTVTGLVGGRYFAVALPYRTMLGPDVPQDFFEALTKDATRVVVSDDERRVVDLRVSARPEGDR